MPNLSIMIKPSSSKCNLRCKYCFYQDEASSRSVADYGFMAVETFDILLEKAQAFANGGHIHFTFQGGEPLLIGKQFYKHVFFALSKADNVSISVQTNATLIDDEWASMFKNANILVGVSIDGNKKANKYRYLTGGENCFDNVINGINILKKHGVNFNALIVATPWIANNIAEIYAFFKRNNIKYLQFIPCLNSLNGDNTYVMTAKQYGEMLDELFRLYKQDYLNGNYVSIRYFDNLISYIATGQCEQCGMGGVCQAQYVAEANGNIYPCDFYCMDEYFLGNIHSDSFDKIARAGQEFTLDIAPNKLECKECNYFGLCKGAGCKRERASADYCQAYKYFFGRNWNALYNFLNNNKGYVNKP